MGPNASGSTLLPRAFCAPVLIQCILVTGVRIRVYSGQLRIETMMHPLELGLTLIFRRAVLFSLHHVRASMQLCFESASSIRCISMNKSISTSVCQPPKPMNSSTIDWEVNAPLYPYLLLSS